MMMMMMMVIILIIIKKKYSYMKHYNNTQPNLIIHYISHSIPSLPYIHTRTPTYTVSQPQSRSLSILIFWILFTVYVDYISVRRKDSINKMSNCQRTVINGLLAIPTKRMVVVRTNKQQCSPSLKQQQQQQSKSNKC